MTILSNDDTQHTFSTAWLPLDELAEQWAHFGCTHATSQLALQVTSVVFRALAQETEARAYHIAAGHTLSDLIVTELEVTLEALRRALVSWSDALTALRLLPDRSHSAEDVSDDEVARLVIQVMQQRLRLSALVQEVGREQLTCSYRKGVRVNHLTVRSSEVISENTQNLVQ